MEFILIVLKSVTTSRREKKKSL